MLLIFSKYPRLGRVKTRLIPALGQAGALALYEKLLQRCELEFAPFQGPKQVCWAEELPQNSPFFAPNLGYTWAAQQGEDLGQRMYYAFEQALAQGAKAALLVGCDCPDLSLDILNQAWQLLQTHDAVLGPALDGGYYLIGLKQLDKPLFFNRQWSHEAVRAEALARFEALSWSYALLPLLSDLDSPEDLSQWPHLR